MAFISHPRDRLLENPSRAKLYAWVRENPGVHRAELVAYLGIGQGATRHHLDQLVKNRLVLEARDNGFVRYFAAGEVSPADARREAVLRAGSNRRVHAILSAEPGLTLREVGERLGISAPSVHRCVKRLREAGLLPPRSASPLAPLVPAPLAQPLGRPREPAFSHEGSPAFGY